MIREISCKSILSQSKIPGANFAINPYVGCSHGCVYCYAKFMKKYTHHEQDEWGKFIDIRQNAIDILEKEIQKVKANETVMLGSVTDAYQPIEKQYQLTRNALMILKKYHITTSILTKSDLILRDIDLLKEFENVKVGISMSCVNEKYTSVIEPGASSPSKRINALKVLKQEKIPVYVFMSPLIPYVSKLEDVIVEVAPYVDDIMAEVLNVKMTSIPALKKKLQQMFTTQKVEQIVKLCYNPIYLEGAKNKFNELCKKYHVRNTGFFMHNQQK